MRRSLPALAKMDGYSVHEAPLNIHLSPVPARSRARAEDFDRGHPEADPAPLAPWDRAASGIDVLCREAPLNTPQRPFRPASSSASRMAAVTPSGVMMPAPKSLAALSSAVISAMEPRQARIVCVNSLSAFSPRESSKSVSDGPPKGHRGLLTGVSVGVRTDTESG